MREARGPAEDAGWWMIPPTVLARRDLSLREKALVGQVIGLVSAGGCCAVSNARLGALLGITKQSASRLVAGLVQKGLLEVVVTRDESGQVIGRAIEPAVALLADGVDGGR